MSVSENFQALCNNLTVDSAADIDARRKVIYKRLNSDFWGIESDSKHGYYVGSYGRETAIRNFHDLDVLFQLPSSYYTTYNAYSSNGQSALLQVVKNSVKKTYSQTDVGGDGQVVVVLFSDGMRFEILPAFENNSGSYTYPDSNNGGSWETTNPFPEISAISATDKSCNNNLKRLCRMARAWRRKWDVPIGGLLIDTLANSFLQSWEYKGNSFVYYDWMGRDFFQYLANRSATQSYWLAPGSGQQVWRKGVFESKAKQCYNLSLEAIQADTDKMLYTAAKKWTEIYGSFYPSP